MGTIAGLAQMMPGLQLILKYEPDAETAAMHDEFFCGSSISIEKMTGDELKIMDDTGWWFVEKFDSWKRFV
jgi:hypothetical protein